MGNVMDDLRWINVKINERMPWSLSLVTDHAQNAMYDLHGYRVCRHHFLGVFDHDKDNRES